MRGKEFLITLFLGVGAAVLLGFAWPFAGSQVVVRAIPTRDLSNAKQVATAISMYAVDNGGVYPVDLRELVPDYLASLDPFLFSEMTSDGQFDPKYDWLYFDSGRDDKHGSRIMLASPQAKRGDRPNKRVVIYADGSGAVVTEEKYQQELHLMIDEMRKAGAPVPPATPPAGDPPKL